MTKIRGSHLIISRAKLQINVWMIVSGCKSWRWIEMICVMNRQCLKENPDRKNKIEAKTSLSVITVNFFYWIAKWNCGKIPNTMCHEMVLLSLHLIFAKLLKHCIFRKLTYRRQAIVWGKLWPAVVCQRLLYLKFKFPEGPNFGCIYNYCALI